MNLKFTVFLIFVLNLWCNVHGLRKQILAGEWRVKNGNSSIQIPSTVPGGIYSDLMSAGILQDIYYRFNDIEYRWVANETWAYTYIFQADGNHFENNYVELVFDGLDTFSDVYLNDIKIGNSNNMFVRYVYDVKPHLKNGDNNLTVIFKSPILESLKLYDLQARQYIVYPICVPKEYHGECHVNHIRKMQASFSWDWGPAFPSVGIWKPVYLRSYNSAVLQDVTVDLKEIDEMWTIDLKIYLESKASNAVLTGLLTTEIATNLNNVSTFTTVNGSTDENGEFVQHVTLSIPKAHVNLWWPNGFGEQRLYEMKFTYTPANTEEKSVKKFKIGFRKVELIQNPISNGLTFYFKVNDLPIFAKGSNWIPANILPEKGANITEMRFLLQSAKDVHMNMLRVWGGGIYESDEFYELADEMGILIWQDFMFACSMYPVDKQFLETVKTEIKQQVRRLQHHASIALWAGNNENEAALVGNWYGTSRNFTLYKQDYIILYVDTIREVCLQNDQFHPFVVSSPSNGLESEKEGYVAKNPYDTHFGDLHYYNYILDGWNQNIYAKTRFSSEYGFQSLPCMSTLLSSTNVTSDLKMDSEFLNSRQHHNAGYNEMKILINKHLQLPNATKDSYLKTYIYFTQISQAMAYKAETEFYRQWRSMIDSNGNGFTNGALYWQLNDVWPAPSWSSIDFRQRWKMVHYFAKKFFAPLLITANISPAQQLTIFAISDLTQITYNASLNISLYKWDSLKPIYSENRTLNILPGYSAIVDQFWLDKYLEDHGCGTLKTVKNNCFVYFTLRNAAGEHLGPDNFVFPAPLKSVNGLTTPNLKISVAKTKNGNSKSTSFNLIISTDRITPFVWLETEGIEGRFSDNGFLQVTKYKTVQFECTSPITPMELQSSLRITSLRGSEHL